MGEGSGWRGHSKRLNAINSDAIVLSVNSSERCINRVRRDGVALLRNIGYSAHLRCTHHKSQGPTGQAESIRGAQHINALGINNSLSIIRIK